MKNLTKTIAFLTGGLFVFSGLVKLNDPMGTAIKMKEYFQVFSEDFGSFFEVFIPYALPVALIMIVFEVVLGVALMIRYQAKLMSKLALVLIIFFTFLTFYSAVFNKVRDCGCFGDFIKLDPYTSFYKDLMLLGATLFLVAFRRHLRPLFTFQAGSAIFFGSLALSIILGYWAIEHLPFFDWRPYKVGNNIPKLMEPEEPPDFEYVMTKNGKKQRFKEYPSDTTFKFDTMITLNPEKSKPKIQDFALYTAQGEAVTDTVFSGTKLLVLLWQADKADKAAFQEINPLIEQLRSDQSAMDFMALTPTSPDDFEKFRHQVNLAIPWLNIDATVIKAMIRANPGLMLLHEGTVLGKWHHNDIPPAERIRELAEEARKNAEAQPEKDAPTP